MTALTCPTCGPICGMSTFTPSDILDDPTVVEYALIRKAMRDEASGIDGLESDGSSPSPVWRWPLRSVTDPAYLEDVCAYCGETLGRLRLNTGNGPHHKDCWNERTKPGNREEAR